VPALTLIAVLIADVNPPLVAVNVYPVPALSNLQPPYVATPAVAAKGFVVHVKAAPGVPVPLVMANMIETVLAVTVLPPAS
jgi:hypothetical protein